MAHSRVLHRVLRVVSCPLLAVLPMVSPFQSVAAQQSAMSTPPSSPRFDSRPLPLADIGFKGVLIVLALQSDSYLLEGNGQQSLAIVSAAGRLKRRVRYEHPQGPSRIGVFQDSLVWLWRTGDSTARLMSESRDSVGWVSVPTVLRDAEGLPLGVGSGGLQGTFLRGIPSPNRRLFELSLIGRGVQPPADWPARPDRSTAAYLLTDADGRMVEFLGWGPSDAKCRKGTQLVPLCRYPFLLVSPTGDMLVTARSDEPSGDSVRVHLSVILLPEVIRRDTTIVVPRIPLTTQQVDSVRLERLRDAPPSRRPSWADEVAALPIPDFRPPFETFRIGTDRTIWLIIHHDERDRDILVLNRDLQVVARRRMPRDVRLEAATGTHAVVRGIVAQGDGPLYHVRW